MFENPILHFIAAVYERIIKIGSNLQSLLLFWMRLTWGQQFLSHGLAKLHDIEGTAQFFASLDIHHPYFHAHLVGYTEAIGGLCLMVGLASRLVSIPLIVIMVTALSSAHINIFERFRFVLEPSMLSNSAPYPFLITAMLVLIFGPGRISLDAWLKRWSDTQPKY